MARPTAKAAEVRPSEFAAGAVSLIARMRSLRPTIACFHGVTGYRHVAAALGSLCAPNERFSLGLRPLRIGDTRIFLAPNPSGANAHYSRDDQVRWYDALADAVASSAHADLSP